MDQLRAVAVAVTMEQIALANPWVDRCWRPRAVTPAGAAQTGDGVCIDNLELRLHPDEAENYLLNLTAPAPCLFVVWRLESEAPTVVTVSASYGEAARMLDAGEQVDALPLPEDLRGWIEDFSRHYYRAPEKKPKGARYARADREERAP